MSRRRGLQRVQVTQVTETPDRSFWEATEEFLTHCKLKGLSEHTIAFYRKELKGLKRSLIELETELDCIRNLNTTHIERWVEFMVDDNRAISSINARIRAGRTFMNFCERKGYVDSNPFEGVQQLRIRHTVGATLSKNQLDKLLKAPDLTQFVGLRDYAIMLTLAHTGVRLKELCSLNVQDVSFDGSGAVTVQQAKNRMARRIPMTKRLKRVLKAYVEERGVLETDSLFISVENDPINPRTVQERLKHYGKLTGVENEVTVSPHTFRRTFARLKVEAGVNLFVLQQLTGHSDLEILKRYVQIYSRDLEDVIEKGI